MKRVVVLVGASGAGKTTVAEILARRAPWRGHTHYFDAIGVPSPEEMASGDWGGEEWQLWATRQWMGRLAANDARLQLLEGQTRPSFVRTASEPHPDLHVEIILLDCSTQVRRRRLVELRGRLELANAQMENWAAYLAGQAHALGLPVIDTSHLDPTAVADRVEELAGSDRARG